MHILDKIPVTFYKKYIFWFSNKKKAGKLADSKIKAEAP